MSGTFKIPPPPKKKKVDVLYIVEWPNYRSNDNILAFVQYPLVLFTLVLLLGTVKKVKKD